MRIKYFLLPQLAIALSLNASENFDKSYFGLSFGVCKVNYEQENTAPLFPRDKTQSSYNWGHYFTDYTSYDLCFFENKDRRQNVQLTSGDKFVSITLASDLLLNTLARTRQFTLRLRHLIPFKEISYGVYHIEGLAGYSQVWKKHRFSNPDGSTNLTEFSLRHTGKCPHLGAGLVFIPHRAAYRLTAHYNYDAYSTLGTTSKTIFDGAATELGVANLKANDGHTLKIGLEFTY